MKLLVAHPSPLVAEGMADLLRSQLDARTTIATTLAECLLLVAQGDPDLAVVDVELAPGQELGLCDRLVQAEVRPLMVIRGDATAQLALLEHGAVGIVVAADGIGGVLAGIRTVLDGHVHVPPHLLGAILHQLIVSRREAPAEDGERLTGLSPRELEVLALLGAGADTREIAEHLVISPHTAKTHINRVLGKLRVTSRGEAAALARDHGVVPSLKEAAGE